MSSTKLPKGVIKEEPVQIKSENSGPHPLSHYVDDRIELAKQIFSTLKAKTIRNLAPNFLKTSPIEEIKELCLNELLGLSTKRLLSIINAQKCPTDTESSSDSDVRNVEEHISLEEISSDSETGRKHNANRLKKKKKNAPKQEKNPTDGANDKGVSVLELLELQARARAIRSQLALEPVAKIEVDSDDSMDENSQSAKTSQASTSKPTDKKLTNGNALSTENPKKRIKLKRNFRKANVQDENDDEADDGSKKGKADNDVKCSDEKEAEHKTDGENKDDEKRERSTSPDVITILPSPETLFISDSSDENEQPGPSSSKPKSPDNARREDECCEIVAQEKRKSIDSITVTQDNVEKIDNITEPAKSQTDIEDGEIEDCKESNVNSNKTDTNRASTEILENRISPSPTKPEEIPDNEQGTENKNAEERNSSATPSETLESRDGQDISNKLIDDAGQKSEDQVSNDHEDETECDDLTHHNDDVISLEHDDLDDLHDSNNDKDVSTPVDEVSVKKEQIKKALSVEADNDIITLDNSTDDESSLGQFADSNESQSWNSRWLKSDRVNKILATSRLGNRVREKRKKSKKQSEIVEEEEIIEKPQEVVYQSQYEDGSVQQYTEILERNKSS